MAFQGLGLHLGVVVVTHVVKQAAIVVQEFLVYGNPVPRVSLLAVSGIFSRKHDVILHRDSTLQRPSWVRNLVCLEAVNQSCVELWSRSTISPQYLSRPNTRSISVVTS